MFKRWRILYDLLKHIKSLLKIGLYSLFCSEKADIEKKKKKQREDWKTGSSPGEQGIFPYFYPQLMMRLVECSSRIICKTKSLDPCCLVNENVLWTSWDLLSFKLSKLGNKNCCALNTNTFILPLPKHSYKVRFWFPIYISIQFFPCHFT